MAKQLNVSLAFTANTNEAIASIKNLQKELNGLATGAKLKNSGITELTPEIQRAMVAAGELQAKLEGAVNVKTGKLDLSQFSDSLKKSGTSLQDYAKQLNALGPAGRQAFTNLAQSVLQAEAPLIRCSQRVKELGTTLANTARWQISSSILHNFMGTVQSAYGYAQDLNKSLNDIRIVTGASISEMDAFAEKANKAARALSATTNEYAKASLIYFQQGDTEAQAMDKAAITTKMANVTGQSAEVVSNQLTAIWNNFNKEGDVAYEHYADVLTKLGAATASSTDEIAGGLEKFAGIADQIGLSYEYAASALATITSVSRESEDVVGTALKTIFARIQGLNLGETLDDGTTLNKYSEALQKVGISIFDQAGELKDMDDILEEMADRWKTLSRDQQVALAQAVAGVRQYNQLMTLMNSWDVMDNNLIMANSADGELEKQAEIYAESWEAARDRVSAAAENIYAKILDDDFFISFLDGFANVIDGVSGLIDAFGGLQGVLFTVGAIASQLFHNEIVKGLKNTAYNLKQLTPLGKKEQAQTKEDALKALRDMKSSATGAEGQAENAALTHEVEMQEALMHNAKKLTDEELKQLQIQMDTVRALDKRAIATAKNADEARKELEHLQTMNKIQAQMDARAKVRNSIKNNAEQEFFEGARNVATKGQNKTLVDQRKEKLYHAAENQVREANGLAKNADLKGFEDQVKTAFINGVREAANSSDKYAQQVAKELETKMSVAQAAISKKMNAAMAKARQDIEVYDKKIEDAATANVSATSLKEMTGNMLTSELDKKNTEELAQLQNTLKEKILATKQAAETLSDELGDEERETQLKDDIKVLSQLADKIGDATLDAKEFAKVLNDLQTVAPDSSNFAGMDINDRIANAAQIAGMENEQAGSTNTDYDTVNFEGHYEAARKKAEQDLRAKNAKGDVEAQKGQFDAKIDDAGGLQGWADGIANVTTLISGLGAVVSSVQGAIDVFNNPDSTAWDKVVAVFGVLMTALPLVPPLFSAIGASGAAAGAGVTAAMGPVGWIILGIVAAVTALTLAFSALSDIYNADAIAAKKAAENAEALASASEKAKQQLEGIKNGFDAYDTAVEKLNSCVKGTEEWNEALSEVNDTVMGLLDTYPELLGQKDLFTRNKDGMLEINDDARAKIIQQAENAADTAQAAALVSKARAAEAMATSQNTNTQRQIGSFYSYDSQGYVDASVHAGKILTENKDKLAGLTGEEFEEELRKLIVKPAGMVDSEYESMIAKLTSYQSSIDSLVAATEKAATQMDNATLMLANEHLQGQGYGATETAAAAEAYEKAQEEIYNKIIKADADNNSQATRSSTTAEEIWGRFQQATGTTYGLANNAVRGNDNNRTYAYVDETGAEKTYTIEYIAQTIAAAEAMESMGAAAKDTATLLSQLGESGVAFAAALGSGTDQASMANFMSDMTQAEVDAIGKEITVDKAGNATISDAGLAALGVTREQFEQLATTFGISVQDLTNNLSGAYNQVSETIASNQEYFTKAGIDASKMSIAEQTKLISSKDAFNKQADTQGLGKNSLDAVIAQNANLDPEKLVAFVSGMSNISLTSEDAVKQIQDLADTYGVQGDAITSLMGQVEGLDQVYSISTNSIAEQTKKLQDVVGDGLSTGDNVSEENLKILEEVGINTEQYFTQMADGTYSLTGDAEEFNRIVNQITFDGLKEQLADFNNVKKQTMDNFTSDYLDNDTASNLLRNSSVYSTQDLMSQGGSLSSGSNAGYAAEDLGQARLDYMSSFEDGTFDFNAEQLELLSSYQTNPNLALTAEQLSMIADMMGVVNAKESDMQAQALMTATSLEELNAKAAELGSVMDSAYGEALVKLASNYDNCVEEIEEYNKALCSGNKDQINAAKSALQLSVSIGEMSKKFNLDAKATENYAKRLAKSMNLDEDAAAKLAVANQRLDRGLTNLNENFDDYSKALKENSKNSAAWSETMDALKTDLADILNVGDASMLTDSFAEATLASDDLKLALDGDVEAIKRLQTAAADDIMINIVANQSEDPEDLVSRWQQLKTDFEAIGDINAPGVDQTNLLNSFNEMIRAGNMTKDQIEAALAGLHVSANVKTTYVSQKQQVPLTVTETAWMPSGTMTVPVPDGAGGVKNETYTSMKRVTKTYDAGTSEADVVVPQYEIEGTEGPGGITTAFTAAPAPTVSKSATTSGNTGGGGGGGGNRQDKKVTRTKKDDVVERYKELKDKLDDVRDAADKTSASLGRLHGPEKLEAIKKIIAAEQEEMDLLQQQADLAKGHLTEDLAALQTAAGAVGVAFTIDENGNLSNYTDQMNALYERLSAQEAALEQEAADLAAIQSDAAYEAALAEYEVNEQALEQLREQIQELEAAQQQYEETRELLEDIDLQLEEMKGEEALPLVDSDLIDMLQEVDDVLDDIEGSIDRMTQKAERLVGASRIAALKEIAKLERERLATLQRRQQVLDKDIDDKRDAVDTIAARNNVEFEYDENGNIVNYEAQMQKMSQEYRELYEQASADGLITEAEQAGLDALKEDMDELQEYVDAYNEAVEEAESNQEAQLEAYYAWQDANAEALNETLSMKIEIDDRALRRVEYYLNKLNDDFYSSAEAAALLAGQQDIYNSKLGAYEQQLNDLETAYNNGEISLEAYVSGMQECQDGIYENLEALQELDKAMMEYYGETLAKAQDELAKYTDKMNLQMESLSYYQSLLTLMGKQNDYKKMDTILRGQADLLADQVEVAKESAAFFKAEADAKWQLYQNALASGDSAAAELYKKEYEAALEASNQAQSDYIAKSQEYVESLKAVFENTLASINHDFEEALTGGSSFDQLATEMKRAKSLQEEFLTTTNQIYETNKLMHKTQQEIDKSSNSVAKEKLKNFINETQQLQNKTKLSKYELEIQQAKYDLLMAEIALEEAQAAKSTVRLQRDSEGNFGYVYTADSSKVADAEQKLADAQNKLYNVALNGANEYTEKYQQTLSEMYDTLTGLQQQYLNGAFASEEEYNAAVTAAKEYYYAKLEEYSSLHAIALQTDSRVVEEAWSSELSSMVYNTGTWKQNVEQYITDVGIAFNAWHDEMAAILGEAGLASDFSNLGDRVDEVTQDSEELKNEIVNQVLPALQNELQAVSQVTGAWATQRAEMLDTIKQYEDLTTEINTAIDALLELRDLADDPLPNPPEVPEQESSGSDPEPAPTPEPAPEQTEPEPTPPPAPEQTEPEEDEVESYQTGTLKFEYNAPDRVWTDSASKRYEWGSAESDKMQAAFDKAYAMNGGYTGDYWKGWSGKGGLLDADVLHKKYGLATGGYTGDWEGSYGKLAFLHQKELVLNAGDTENFLASMDLLNKIVSAIDLYSLNSQLSGALYSPTIGSMNNSDTVEQQVHIEASFPNVSSHSEIEEAFNNLVNQASQYANRR